MSKPLNVMIIGAGTGGLCLAHGLSKDGITVEVFERDDSPADHQPGYRLSIARSACASGRVSMNLDFEIVRQSSLLRAVQGAWLRAIRFAVFLPYAPSVGR